MKFAAIDIGSNAIRLLIADVNESKKRGLTVKKLALTRVPVRLGSSVFESGYISEKQTSQLAKTMKAFKYLIDVYEVAGYRACATSAMREAENSDEIIKQVKDFSGIDIEVIDGKKEADLIFSTFITQNMDFDQTYLYIDVGGGSTEITLLKNARRTKSRSFKIGTVRLLEDKVKDRTWNELKEYVAEITKEEEDVIGIGTGGNINRLFKLNNLNYGELLTLTELKSTAAMLNSMSFEERVENLRLREDRADVIIPATKIYLTVLNAARINNISVPKIGLSDGIALNLYQKINKKISQHL